MIVGYKVQIPNGGLAAPTVSLRQGQLRWCRIWNGLAANSCL